ncbi:MAG TPA: class I SAM-dependent methyltransferase [Steroidobacter sp.]|uniref:class I SAM-dependent methyltransferase n=1 Tax=Steroidobacter sp. TaxID=1978227 RepID=UPI002EDA8FF9
MSATHEIASKQRFEFGDNWARFLATVDDRAIAEAEVSLQHMLGVTRLDGLRFLDIGSGSGLFSLAARRLGATVHSFDYDPQSVACTQELKRRYRQADEQWRIESGSVLDRNYLSTLGRFDIVYSWGVLHHTGAMWLALEHAIGLVEPAKGKLFIALYNDQGWKSHVWWLIKRLYNMLPRVLRAPFVATMMLITHIVVLIKYTLKLQPMTAINAIRRVRRERGMTSKYDQIDWVGGFPYEFVGFDTMTRYLEARGFTLINSRRNTSLGCNEWAAERVACAE